MLEIYQVDKDILNRTLFSDEGNFRILKLEKGKKNRNKNKRKISESTPLPEIVWCAMTPKEVIGPYYFNSHVTGVKKLN